MAWGINLILINNMSKSFLGSHEKMASTGSGNHIESDHIVEGKAFTVGFPFLRMLVTLIVFLRSGCNHSINICANNADFARRLMYQVLWKPRL